MQKRIQQALDNTDWQDQETWTDDRDESEDES